MNDFFLNMSSLSLFDQLPHELFLEITSYLPVSDLCTLQKTCTNFCWIIWKDPTFVRFNTLKFFRLFYQCNYYAPFLLPYLNTRYSCQFIKDRDGNPIDTFGNTVLHVVVSQGDIDSASILLSSQNRFRPRLHLSVSVYDREILGQIQLVCPENEFCALSNLMNAEPNNSLQYISIVRNTVSAEKTLKIAEFLLDAANIDLFAKGRAGNTVLSEAAQHGQQEMVRLILEKGKRIFSNSADFKRFIDKPNDYGENALMLASKCDLDIVQTLLDYGANPNPFRSKQPLIHIVCSELKLDRQHASAFRRYHNERTERWGQGYPLLTHTADLHHESNTSDLCANVLRALVKYGADVHCVHEDSGMRPLHTAAFWGNTAAIKYLIQECGVDPNLERNPLNSWLPIHYACSEMQIFSIQTLLTFGSNVFESDLSDTNSSVAVPPPLDLLIHDVIKAKIRKFAKEI